MANIAPFPVDEELTGVVIAYENEELVHEQVLPERMVGIQSYKYWFHDINQQIHIPDTSVGRTSEPNVYESQMTEATSSTKDYGLQQPVPNADIINANGQFDPLAMAAEDLMAKIKLDREERTATLVFTSGNYPAANVTTLATSSRWSDAASTPIEDIEGASEAMIMRPNTLVLGSITASYLRRHPAIIKAWHGNLGDDGLVPISALAAIFDIPRVVVGRAWQNSANPGQTASRARIWGPHAALLRIESAGGPNRRLPTFGWTAKWGATVAARQANPKLGLKGGWEVWAGESVDEKITGNELGYLFVNAGDDA